MTDLIKIVDNSHWRPVEDFQQLKDWGIQLLISKATEGRAGDDRIDVTWDWHGLGAQEHDIPFLGFHYLRAEEGGHAQYENWYSAVELHDTMLPILCIDFEGTGNVGSAASRFILQAERMCADARIDGFKTMAYSNFNYFNNFLGSYADRLDAAFDYFWITLPSSDPNDYNVNRLYNSSYWKVYPHKEKTILWQYTWDATVPGMPPEIDLNRWLRSEEKFLEFVQYEPPPSHVHEELEEQIALLTDTVVDHETQIAALEARIATLEVRADRMEGWVHSFPDD